MVGALASGAASGARRFVPPCQLASARKFFPSPLDRPPQVA